MSCAENVQGSEPVAPLPESVSVPSDSQVFSVVLSGKPDVTPEVETPVTVTVWVSDRSASVNFTVP